MNVANHVVDVASNEPGRVALIFSGESWTYAELLAAAVAQEAELNKLGVATGDRVAIVLPNSVTSVVIYLACMRRGYVAVPVNPGLSVDEILHVLVDSGAVLAVVLDGFERLNADAVSLHVIRLGRTVPRPKPAASVQEIPPAIDLDGTHPATILYTSGTTGRPKGALLSHHNVIFTMQSKVRYLELRQDDVLLLFLPIYHCYGLNAILNPGLLAGATVVLAERFDRQQTLNLINDHNVTRLFAVPQVFRLLHDGGVTPEAIPTVHYALSAGDVLQDDVRQLWQERMGWPIHQAYGLTETSPFVTYNSEPDQKPASVGKPIDGVDVAIRHDFRPVPVGEIGEVWVRGPNVMLGYWNSPEATAAAIHGGWLRTADLGWLEDDGYLFLAGRSSEVIIVAGQNVYTAEVERVLLADRNVADAAVYGLPHDIAGEIVGASVVPTNNAVTAQQLRAACASQLAKHKVPVVLDLVDSLPTLSTGKKDRRTMAARVRERFIGRTGMGSQL